MAQPSEASSEPAELVLHLVSVLRDFDAATLVTRSRTGSLHGRPMSIARVDDNVTIWFITSVTSAKAEELAEDARAMVTLQAASRFVCLNGSVELVFDRAQIKSLWHEAFRVWFDGEDDPDIVLLKFTAFDAEYWDKSGLQGVKQVLQAARAYVTGQKIQDKPELANDTEAHAHVKLWDPSLRVGANAPRGRFS